MNKLSKRQIIILSIAALSVIYGGYLYLIASPASNKVKTNDQNQEISALVSSLKNDLVKDTETGMGAYIIARAEADWQKNPFWDKSSYKEWAAIQAGASGSSSEAKIIYSGYVDVGKNKMAVINGLEYSVGDQLENGYVLKKITTAKVVISNKKTGNELEIVIQE